jgi:hypothetical protein
MAAQQQQRHLMDLLWHQRGALKAAGSRTKLQIRPVATGTCFFLTRFSHNRRKNDPHDL